MKLLMLLVNKRRNMRIVKKLVIAYILLICFPFIIFGFLVYQQMVINLYKQYRTNQIQFVEQAYHNLKMELSKIESTYSLYQNNRNLIEYIDGNYHSDWEMIYNYQRFIKPTFTFTYLSNPVIEDIKIYKHNLKALPIKPVILNMVDLERQRLKDRIQFLPPNQGVWTYNLKENNNLPIIHYTHKLNNENYTRELGYLHLTVNNELINLLFESFNKGKSWNWLLDGNLTPVYQEAVPGWDNSKWEDPVFENIDGQVKNFYVNERGHLVSVIPINEMDLIYVNISEVESLLNIKELVNWVLAGGILLLILLSFIYFMIASSIALRISRFSNHLKQVPTLKYARFPDTTDTDEIGFLITSYNNMVKRMTGLEHEMHRTVLLKKDAEIKMLQAQIKPHFLYNTLESMRMMALVKNDNELAEMIYTLGKLLRYSIGKNGETTTLQQEVDNIMDYIAIHKIRMGDRLEFEINVEPNISDFACPKFILQPVVENSIIHGFGETRKQGIIRIDIDENLSHMKVRILNNGSPISSDKIKDIRAVLAGDKRCGSEKKGIGLFNVQERIRAFFGEESGIFMESDMDHGTLFELRLQKKEDE
ncbi:two-component system, sensor histidine kinase YesM [Gracilibacillus ureilyticus]|uniref:Two-component system, sensor histidine kinase YesM n=1 Tax=Gracilibacillus ureilyticus TaxID=531814 RepID=A0A1H9VXV0_9BACI|nr:histidine kinase [Gracilibacillus ureilyticus]SES26197.1 two-component system, sensor histidine kinase YesM [Gracilibacillus ureilyticus]